MENLRQIQDHFLEFPKHKDIKGALFQISSEIGSFEFFEQQQKYFTTDDLSEEAKKHIGLANYLVSHELSNDLYLTRLARLFQSIEEESDKFIKLLCSDDANVAVVGTHRSKSAKNKGSVLTVTTSCFASMTLTLSHLMTWITGEKPPMSYAPVLRMIYLAGWTTLRMPS